jgi:hypothetical protein
VTSPNLFTPPAKYTLPLSLLSSTESDDRRRHDSRECHGGCHNSPITTKKTRPHGYIPACTATAHHRSSGVYSAHT